MTKTFEQIKTFYKSNWDTLSIFDLSLLASHCAMSVPTGSAIEVSHFDGFTNRRKLIKPVDRIDAAETLRLVSELLNKRLETLPSAELEALNRMQAMMAQVSELPKRLDHPGL